MLFVDYACQNLVALRVWGCGGWGLSAGLGGCCQVVFEASGVDEAADGVVGEVAQVPGRCRVGAPGAR